MLDPGLSRREDGPVKLLASVVVILLLGISCSSDKGGESGASSPGTSGTAASPSTAGSTVPDPALRIEGPITAGTRGTPGTATPVDLESAGYVEEEFFVSGDATSYRPDGELGTDGEWSVEEDGSAAYTTRLLVRRPTDPAAFSGTVLVEWFNVTSNVDADVDFGFASDEILRNGDVWVGVSAQQVGITSTEGGQFGADALGLAAWDPERYGALDHPGDQFSYDIFTQAGRAVSAPGDSDLLSGFAVEQVLAIGESQSAFRLLTYVNAVQPLAGVYDGFLIHSRDGGGATLGGGGGDPLAVDEDDAVPPVARVRSDLDVPVFQLTTETDLFSLRPTSPFPEARQPDTDKVRTWEMAGTSHADAHYLAILNEQGRQNFDSFLDLSAVIPIANDGPQHWIIQAALRELRAWASGSSIPPTADPVATSSGAIERDQHGNALGGVRTPHVDVPVATLTGEGSSFIGATTPLPADVLTDLYPTEADYLAEFEDALDRTVEAGFILAVDAEAVLAERPLP